MAAGRAGARAPPVFRPSLARGERAPCAHPARTQRVAHALPARHEREHSPPAKSRPSAQGEGYFDGTFGGRARGARRGNGASATTVAQPEQWRARVRRRPALPAWRARLPGPSPRPGAKLGMWLLPMGRPRDATSTWREPPPACHAVGRGSPGSRHRPKRRPSPSQPEGR